MTTSTYKIPNRLAVGIIPAPAGFGEPIAENEIRAAGMSGDQDGLYRHGSLRYT
jgi:hypothetical protein